METREELLEKVRKRMPVEHQSCQSCWSGREHTDADWKNHYREGRGEPMSEPLIRKVTD
jgi:hypothetical protein